MSSKRTQHTQQQQSKPINFKKFKLGVFEFEHIPKKHIHLFWDLYKMLQKIRERGNVQWAP